MFTSVAASWQNLPADILLLIAERSVQIRHLRAVCSSWRSSLPLPYKLAHHPLRSAQIPFPLFDQDHLLHCDDDDDDDSPESCLESLDNDDADLTLTERNIYCLEPIGNDDTDSPESCWIVKLEEMSSGKMRFYHPLSYWSIPPASTFYLPAAVDFLDCGVILVGKEYDFRYEYFSSKVVLSDDAMLCRFGNRNLGYFKFGDKRWTMILDRGDHDELSYFITDIIYHKRKFYVIDATGRIIVVDSSSLKVEVFVSPRARVDQGSRYRNEWFFVQSDGDLFVVNKYYPIDQKQMACFKVYRLNSDEQEWNEVTDLGDQSFFISDGGCTFSIGSGQFSGCSKNLIYCADEPGDNISISSLEDDPLQMISRDSRLFWPILPSWLKQTAQCGLEAF